MSILDMWGFEWGSADIRADYEGITFIFSAFDYGNNPGDGSSPVGNSRFFLRTDVNGQAIGVVTPQSLPSGSQFWLHFLWREDSHNTSSPLQFVEWRQGTTRMGAVRLQSNTGLAEAVVGGNPIVAVDTVADTFSIAGDVSSLIAIGSQIQVQNQGLGNDGFWTVTSVTFSSPNTVIGVQGNIPSPVVGGDLAYPSAATAAKAIFGCNRWRRVHVHVNLQNTATGWIRVYYDGDLSAPVLDLSSLTTNPGSLTLDSLAISLSNNGNFIDDLVMMDPLDATGVTDPEKIAYVTISGKAPDADGFYSAWTATPGVGADYEDINDSPPDDASFIQATAINQASTFGFEAADPNNSITAVKWKGRFLRSDTVAGANMNVRQRDVSATTDYDTADIPVPGDGFIFRTFDQKPGGGDWTVTDFDDTEFGPVSKT